MRANRNRLEPVARFAFVALATAMSMLVHAASVGAQPAEATAVRRELIESAQQARTAGDHPRALELAERAARIQMTPSLRLFIAQEQNAVGRVAEAYGNATGCAADANADPALPNQSALAGACSALAATLRTRVARVTILLPPNAPADVRIDVGDETIPVALTGIAYPVAPGDVHVVVSAPGFRTSRSDLHLGAGESSDVRIELVREEPERAASPGPSAAPTPISSTAPTPSPASGPPVTVVPERHRASATPWIVGGVGAGLVVLGLVAWGGREVFLSECTNHVCPNQSTKDDVYAATGVSLVSLGLGVAALAVGIGIGLSNRRGEPRTHSANVWLVPLEGGAFVGVGGRM